MAHGFDRSRWRRHNRRMSERSRFGRENALRRLTKSTVESELGAVRICHGSIIISVGLSQRLNRGDSLLRANDENHRAAGGPGLADSRLVFVGRFNRLSYSHYRMSHSLGGSYSLSMGLCHFGSNAILNP